MFLSENQSPATRVARRPWLMLVALLPFVSIPLLGLNLYFRHDDSALLLWAKEFSAPWYHAFSVDPTLNHYANYPGMGPYWRPFIYLYIKMLWHLFGATPAPYFLVGGLAFMAAVYLLFRLVEQCWGLAQAVWACLFLFAAFHNTMYNLFHLTIQVSFFYQIVMIYCFWAYLQRQRWYHLAMMALFLVPAMGRQTTPILLSAILLARLIEQWSRRAQFWRQNWPALLLLIPGFGILPFSSQTSYGSVIGVGWHPEQILAFLAERFFYYGTILTGGLTGMIMLLLFSGGVLQHLMNRFKISWASGLLPPLTLLVTVIMMHAQPYGIFWLAFCCLYLFLFDDELRLLVGWAGASLLCFISANYYHNGYLLESGFSFAPALAILFIRLSKPVLLFWKQRFAAGRRRVPVLAASAVLLVAPFLLALTVKTSILRDAVGVVRIALASNRNFEQLMNYLRQELPPGATIYELSEEELGTTRFARRYLPLKERAARVKIMNIEDKLVMLKVLGRDDLKLYPASQMKNSNFRDEAYFIVLNNFEKEIANACFKLAIVQEFRCYGDSAVIYRVVHDR